MRRGRCLPRAEGVAAYGILEEASTGAAGLDPPLAPLTVDLAAPMLGVDPAAPTGTSSWIRLQLPRPGRTSAAACTGGAGASLLHRVVGEDTKEAASSSDTDCHADGIRLQLRRGLPRQPGGGGGGRPRRCRAILEEAEAGDCGWRR
jgi:hypothetical protein